MAYEVTATKKRPQTFDELVGQEFVVATLKNSIEQERIAHAYLFSGPRGVGKTSAARILAKALNCENGLTENPCGICTACTEIAHGNSLDVIEIDGASNTGVNDIREIKDEVLFSPNSCRYKIYIIDEVHMLSNSAFNALLKTIEEPPPYIVFIFATTQVHKVPATIRSRCQQFNFRLISIQQVKEMLISVVDELNIQAEEKALFWMAKEATGSLRDAYTLLDQVISFSGGRITLEKIQEKLGVTGIEQINKIGEILINGDKREILEYTADLLNKGISVEQLVVDLIEYFRNLLFVKCGIRKESLLSFAPDNFNEELLDFFSPVHLEKAIEFLFELHRNLKFSLNQRFELELLMSRLVSLKTLITPSEVIETIQTMKAELLSSRSETGGDEAESSKDDAVAEVTKEEKDDSEQLNQLIEAVRKEKLALATCLGKVDSWERSEDELLLRFKDKFSGESVLNEKETVMKHAAGIFSEPVPTRLKVTFIEPEIQTGRLLNEQAEIVKKVFKGEIVKGE